METLKIMPQASAAQTAQFGELVQHCVNAATTTEMVSQHLTIAIKTLQEQAVLQKSQEALQLCLDSAQQVCVAFQREAQRNGGLKYYYYGVFQAQLEDFSHAVQAERHEELKREVTARKHFAPIISTLYKERVLQQSVLCKRVNMEKGNLSREMDRLIHAGFVERRRAGKYIYYNLSAEGVAYCIEQAPFKLRMSQSEMSFSPSQREDIIIDYYTISSIATKKPECIAKEYHLPIEQTKQKKARFECVLKFNHCNNTRPVMLAEV